MKDTMITDEDHPMWNGYLYQLQEEAPRPKAVICRNTEAFHGRPLYFGDEYHGLISREEGDTLCQEEGNFLIRESRTERGRYTLVLRILGVVKNFKLYTENGQHFVGDKRFDDIYALVQDGLITMYVEEKAHDFIQNMSKNKSVYCSLNRTKQLLSQQLPLNSRETHTRFREICDHPTLMDVGRDSPRHAHNGRDTEEAALPYHHQQPALRTQFHNPAYPQSTIAEEELMAEALGNKLQATNMLTEKQRYPTDTPNSCFNQPIQQERSMIQSLMNSNNNTTISQYRPGPTYASRNPNGLGSINGGGTKKTLTPTSSDERKRTKAKKVATEKSMMHQQRYEDCDQGVNEFGGQMATNSPAHARNLSPMPMYDHTRSPSNSSASTTDSEGRRCQQMKPPVPQAFPSRVPLPNNYKNREGQHHSPMRRNDFDQTEVTTQYHCSMPPQHIQANIAHVRQLSGGSTSGSSVLSASSTSGSSITAQGAQPAPLPRTRGMESRGSLESNDNRAQSNEKLQRKQSYHSPSRSRQSPNRQSGFDSSGHEVIPAKTFHQLKMFQRRLEQGSEDGMHDEAKDELATLKEQRQSQSKLTRSNTTIVLPSQRPSSGRAPPRPAPRDIYHRHQRSEPVELLQNLSRQTSFQIDDSRLVENATSRQQTSAFREDLRQQMVRRNREQQAHTVHVEQRTGSIGSTDSSASNISSIGNSFQQQDQYFYKAPDSISHVSSEEWTGEDRESSPSPNSTSQRSCSSDDNSLSVPLSRGSRFHQSRQNAVTSSSADTVWQHKQAEERAARVNESPLASTSNPNHARDVTRESDDVLSALGQATHGPREHPAYRRTHIETVLSEFGNKNSDKLPTHVPVITEIAARPRRKSSDYEKHGHKNSTTKSRHHSETSSEEGTPVSPTSPNITPIHKPLQRRATTGSASPHKKDVESHFARSLNGFVSPIKNVKKQAQRSNSGPSPRKGKKSPDGCMSPRMQHINHIRSVSSPRVDGVPHYDKEHVFKSHTYVGLQWCEYCGNFMWGLIQQGMQCRDCGLNVHKQCAKMVPGDCQPAFKHVKNVFGIDLTALVKLHGTERPIVVDKCIEEIEKRGMESEGIYRVSGLHDNLQELKLVFDRYGSDVDLRVYDDINTVASALKLYLRELPVPLIPYNLYSRFINAAKLSHDDGRLDAIRTALKMMPPAHLQTLNYIVQHLSRICEHEGNQMDAQNLGIVFGQTMLRPPEKDACVVRYNLNDAEYQKEIVIAMIEYRSQLFRPHQEMTLRETHNL